MSIDNVSLDGTAVGALNNLGLFYARATTDRGYKELAFVEGAQSLIARCLLQLIRPYKELDTREVTAVARSEYVDYGVTNFWAAFQVLVDSISNKFSDLDRKDIEFFEILRSLPTKTVDNELKTSLEELIEKYKGHLDLCQELRELIANFKNLKVQGLKADALFDVTTDASGPVISMIVEMQVMKQAMAIRLLSYVCKVFAQMKIALPEIIPNPVYGFALYLEKSDSLLKYSCLDTRAVDVKQEQGSEISICNIYLNDIESYRTGSGREERLKKCQNYWKQRVADWFGTHSFGMQEEEIYLKKKGEEEGKESGFLDPGSISANFEKMSIENKKVYSLIELITLSPLMTPQDVENTLSYLRSAKDKDGEIFQQMYERLKIKEENMEKTEFEDKYGELTRFLREDAIKENSELKKKVAAAEAAGRVSLILGPDGKFEDNADRIDAIIEDVGRDFPGVELSRERVVKEVEKWRSCDDSKSNLKTKETSPHQKVEHSQEEPAA